jgi:hypothetical protein
MGAGQGNNVTEIGVTTRGLLHVATCAAGVFVAELKTVPRRRPPKSDEHEVALLQVCHAGNNDNTAALTEGLADVDLRVFASGTRTGELTRGYEAAENSPGQHCSVDRDLVIVAGADIAERFCTAFSIEVERACATHSIVAHELGIAVEGLVIPRGGEVVVATFRIANQKTGVAEEAICPIADIYTV